MQAARPKGPMPSMVLTMASPRSAGLAPPGLRLCMDQIVDVDRFTTLRQHRPFPLLTTTSHSLQLAWRMAGRLLRWQLLIRGPAAATAAAAGTPCIWQTLPLLRRGCCLPEALRASEGGWLALRCRLHIAARCLLHLMLRYLQQQGPELAIPVSCQHWPDMLQPAARQQPLVGVTQLPANQEHQSLVVERVKLRIFEVHRVSEQSAGACCC